MAAERIFPTAIRPFLQLHWLCFFGSIKLANVSIPLHGLATLSLFTAFTEPLPTRRKIKPFEVALGLLVLAGICMIAGAETGYLLGLCVALLSALLAAMFLVLNRTIMIGGGDPMVMVGWEMVASIVVCFLAIPIFDPVGLLALVCTVFAQALTNRLLHFITAYDFNLATNFEPVTASSRRR